MLTLPARVSPIGVEPNSTSTRASEPSITIVVATMRLRNPVRSSLAAMAHSAFHDSSIHVVAVDVVEPRGECECRSGRAHRSAAFATAVAAFRACPQSSAFDTMRRSSRAREAETRSDSFASALCGDLAVELGLHFDTGSTCRGPWHRASSVPSATRRPSRRISDLVGVVFDFVQRMGGDDDRDTLLRGVRR